MGYLHASRETTWLQIETNCSRGSGNRLSVVAVYPLHLAAEGAVKALQQSGFDMKTLSIVGRDYHTDEHVVG